MTLITPEERISQTADLLQSLERSIRDLRQAAEELRRQIDAGEDAVHGADSGDGRVPEEIARRGSRLEAIRAAKARLEARRRAADDAKGRRPGQDRNPRGGRPYKRPHGVPEATAQETSRTRRAGS